MYSCDALHVIVAGEEMFPHLHDAIEATLSIAVDICLFIRITEILELLFEDWVKGILPPG